MVRKRIEKGVLMLACRDVTRLISLSMDRSLPMGKRVGVRLHILMCRFCARYERQLLLIRETLRRIALPGKEPEGPSVGTLSPEARKRIQDTLSLR